MADQKSITEKRCTGCGLTQSIAEFYLVKTRRGKPVSGLRYQSRCKACVLAVNVEYRALHGDRLKGIQRHRYHANLDAERARVSAWAKSTEGREWIRAYARERRKNDRQKVRVQATARRARHVVRLREYFKAYYAKFRDRRIAQNTLNYAVRSGRLQRPDQLSTLWSAGQSDRRPSRRLQ